MTAQQRFQQAVAYYQRGQFAPALHLLTELSKVLPRQPAVWHVLALTQRKLGQLEESEASFKKCLKLAPNQAEVLSNYGNLLRQLKRNEEARRSFEQALSWQPNFVEARFNLGLLYWHAHDLQAAEEAFREIVFQQPKHIRARIAAADAARLLGDAERGLELLLRQPEAHDVAYLRSRALCYFACKQVQEAIVDLKSAIKLHPQDLGLYETLSDIRWLSGDQDWLREYRQQLSQMPNAKALRIAYVNRLLKAEAYTEAKDELALLLNEQNPELPTLLLAGYLARETGEIDAAREFLERAHVLNPAHQEVINELFTTALAAQRPEQARRYAERLLELNPEHQGWWAMYATALKACGDNKTYRRLYDFDRFVRAYELSTSQSGELSSFNQQLLAVLEQQHVQKQHPLNQSLRSGTQTDGQLFMQNDASVQQLKQMISGAVREYIANLPDDVEHPFLSRKQAKFRYSGAWSVRLNRSGFHRNHYHSEGWISGCFYVSIPKAVNREGHGWIKFGQAELGHSYRDEPDYIVKPQAGMVVLFPSMMWHGTVPFADDAYRVTVAFDLVPEK
ncbi:hypothetical protein CWI80_03570 [Pseudidiomarina sediminum]|uniref:Uncharacterized protein n=1 Tax=Pseudidiomarina sediminum TaxID=431675 RepID=A0A432Z983_9GAMM|nr:tetratricopeptide repeat protein [Pseudidiomarina sediminum]MBY6063608.1 tetratricopeptide repeat protein [Pseudidiomarina sediminum]RUO74430.1 hypothetical protein CWI80_03570 [Pseudidiomarina sediminum]